jgi:predicted DNA-binding transcriptional regulator AlpA
MDTPPIFGNRLYVRERELLALLPFSRTTLWRMERRGEFPRSVRLSAGIKAWRTEDVIRWLQERGWSPS